MRATNILLGILIFLLLLIMVNQRVDVFCFLGKCAAVVH